MISPLSELRRHQAPEFGGKASMLGSMIAANLPVIQGIGISVEHYELALREGNADHLVRDFWHSAVDAERTALSQEIAKRLAGADLSQLAGAVLAALHDLGDDTSLIVRSSATAEDSLHISFAGQFESRRCAADRDGVTSAIRSVWSSCTAPHVAAYRQALSCRDRTSAVDGAPVLMALAIQPYRAFSLAGLLFTQHPLVALKDWMLLEYLDASPSKIVSGEVDPHRCRVSTTSGRVLWERRIESHPILMPEDIAALVDVGSRLRKLLCVDVDIEWGKRDDTVYCLQCRPATTSSVDRVR